ncbi:phage major tail tube protein [Kaistia sp. MMO-174]|uniref:phage major tail tube protein n=1 Tax=Kaistia sp. MMO-174 TaxID=3081256 RepID=UPI003015B225
MSTNTVYVMEAANLFCGDHDPENSKHLTLDEITLPNLQAMYQDHHPGGSFVAMEFEVGIQKLTSSFKLKGWDPELLKQFGLGTPLKRVYTVYGAVRDKRSGNAVQAKAIMEARLGQANADAFQRGNLMGFGYSLNEISHYELHFGSEEILFWDFFTNVLRVGGEDQNAQINNILHIPGVSS